VKNASPGGVQLQRLPRRLDGIPIGLREGQMTGEVLRSNVGRTFALCGHCNLYTMYLHCTLHSITQALDCTAYDVTSNSLLYQTTSPLPSQISCS